MRWPMSTFPVQTVTRPLLPIDSQPSRSGVLARLGLAATRRALLAEAADRPEHAGMGAAAAEVAAQRLAYLGFPRLGRPPQQCRGGDDDPWRAVAALRRAFRDKGLLNVAAQSVLGQSFDGADLPNRK